MRRMSMLLVLVALGIHGFAKDKITWIYQESSIKSVYTVQMSSSRTELIRLYEDGTYEHLNYLNKSNDREEVLVNHGIFEIKKNKILFHPPAKKNFSGKFRYGSFFYNGKIYASWFDLAFRKRNEAFKQSNDKRLFKPFFMCLNSDVVVSNREAKNQLDLNRLVAYIVSDKHTEREKVMALIEFIVASIEYDYEGLRTDNYANKQHDIKSILAGRKRLAVCAGYSNIFKELCKIATIECEKINGYTKYNFNGLSHLGGYHAWNIVTIDGNQKLFDVTWADNRNRVDMKWIDVAPQIMIGSHLPNKKEHQLLDKPITEKDFLSSPIILPMKESAVLSASVNMSAKQFCGKTFRLALPGRHTIKAIVLPDKMIETIYYGEAGAGRGISYTLDYVGTTHYDEDSTYYSIELLNVINPFEIEINGDFSIQSLVFKGDENDLMHYYLSKVDRRHSDAYVKALIAAIKLADEQRLNELLAGTGNKFFDKKGNLKLDTQIRQLCSDWMGELTALTQVHRSAISIENNNVVHTNESTKMHIDIPGKLRFELDYDGQIYSVTKIEVLKEV